MPRKGEGRHRVLGRLALVDASERPLLEADLDPDPLEQFARWFEDARAVSDVADAAALATATPAGRPSVRMVLLKRFDVDGFVFHTNVESRKGTELVANPQAALLLYWRELGRQIRIEGTVSRVSAADAEAYFRTRPRGAQIGAHVSRQSEPIASRDELDARRRRLEDELDGADVPLPAWWGGYRLAPESYEFWQHRDDRLHDRLRYRLVDGRWIVERLQP
jgi:pyridoxamine 5'-phosphate oxidase